MSDTTPAQPVATEAPAAGEPTTARCVTAAPVREQERILTLDVLRGVAVLGILVVNIQFFAFPFPDASNVTWHDLRGGEAAARLFISFFGEFKFITIFSMLFGMGLALQSGRAAQRGVPFGRLYVRRLLVLLVLGVAHGVLLWYGDILSLYALLGFIALACRDARPRTLLITAVILFVVALVFMGGCNIMSAGDPRSTALDWRQLAEQQGEGNTAGFFRFMADEERIYQSGSWGEMVLHRCAMYFLVIPFANLTVIGWRCLALFLLGIYLIRRGFFDDSEAHRRDYRRLTLWGLAVGIALQVIGLVVEARHHGSSSAVLINGALFYVGSLGMSLGYVGAIAWLCLRRERAARLAPVAAVGRMALTNYLAQSVMCGVVFYGYGFGWFGRIGYATALLVVLGIYVAQLVISPIWLRHFRFGPVEWFWRSCTYWQIQPLRR